MEKVQCPYCGYKMPLTKNETAECNGIFVRCKGQKCKKVFEVKIKNGKQVK